MEDAIDKDIILKELLEKINQNDQKDLQKWSLALSVKIITQNIKIEQDILGNILFLALKSNSTTSLFDEQFITRLVKRDDFLPIFHIVWKKTHISTNNPSYNTNTYDFIAQCLGEIQKQNLILVSEEIFNILGEDLYHISPPLLKCLLKKNALPPVKVDELLERRLEQDMLTFNIYETIAKYQNNFTSKTWFLMLSQLEKSLKQARYFDDIATALLVRQDIPKHIAFEIYKKAFSNQLITLNLMGLWTTANLEVNDFLALTHLLLKGTATSNHNADFFNTDFFSLGYDMADFFANPHLPQASIELIAPHLTKIASINIHLIAILMAVHPEKIREELMNNIIAQEVANRKKLIRPSVYLTDFFAQATSWMVKHNYNKDKIMNLISLYDNRCPDTQIYYLGQLIQIEDLPQDVYQKVITTINSNNDVARVIFNSIKMKNKNEFYFNGDFYQKYQHNGAINQPTFPVTKELLEQVLQHANKTTTASILSKYPIVDIDTEILKKMNKNDKTQKVLLTALEKDRTIKTLLEKSNLSFMKLNRDENKIFDLYMQLIENYNLKNTKIFSVNTASPLPSL